MNNSRSTVPAFCAGALMVLVLLAFAVGAWGRPLATTTANSKNVAPPEATSHGITLVILDTPTATASPTPQLVAAVERTSEPDYTPVAPVKVTVIPTPSCADIKTMDIGVAYAPHALQACSATAVLTDTITTEYCAIRRSTCEFSLLADNLDPGILFAHTKLSQLDDEGQLMHPAMLRPLAQLRDAVVNHWHGKYALVVLRAYDPSGADFALQGLSLRVGLSPRTASLPDDIGKLCALALATDFDWVSRDSSESCEVVKQAPALCDVCRQVVTDAEPVLIPIIASTP